MVESPYFVDKDHFTEAEKSRAAHSLWYYSWIRFKRNRLAMAGLYTIIFLVLIALTAGIISPFDPIDQTLEYATKPIGFVGNVIVRTSSEGVDFIPVQKIDNVTGDSVYYVDYNGQNAVIVKSDLAGKDENQWHKQPSYVLGTDR